VTERFYLSVSISLSISVFLTPRETPLVSPQATPSVDTKGLHSWIAYSDGSHTKMLDMLKKCLVQCATLDHTARKPRREKPKPNNRIGDKMRYKRTFKIIFTNGTTTLASGFNKAEAMAFAQQFTDVKIVDAWVVNAEGQRVVPGGHFAKIAKKFNVKYHRGHLWSFRLDAMDAVIEYLKAHGYMPRVYHKVDPVDKLPFITAEVQYM
jgi:hypothetical protein